jgi:perosamine synthetase
LFILRIRPELLAIDRAEFVNHLNQLGIGTSVHFIPLHLHPHYARTYGYKKGDFPQAEDAFARCLSLPIFPDMSDSEIQRVLAAVEQVVLMNRKRVLAIAS